MRLRFVLYAFSLAAAAWCWQQSRSMDESAGLLQAPALLTDFREKPGTGRSRFGLAEDPEELLKQPENQQLLQLSADLRSWSMQRRIAAVALLVLPLFLEGWLFLRRGRAACAEVADSDNAESEQE